MAEEVAGIAVVAGADISDFLRKMGIVESKLDQVDRKASKGVKAGFLGGALGGFVGGAVAGVEAPIKDAFGSVFELLGNIILAAIAPVLIALLPAIEALTPILSTLGEGLAKLINFLDRNIPPAIKQGGTDLVNLLTGGPLGPPSRSAAENAQRMVIPGFTLGATLGALGGAGFFGIGAGPGAIIGGVIGGGIGYATGYIDYWLHEEDRSAAFAVASPDRDQSTLVEAWKRGSISTSTLLRG